jgi:eukaryotic-like serine/threonine-protein kinase
MPTATDRWNEHPVDTAAGSDPALRLQPVHPPVPAASVTSYTLSPELIAETAWRLGSLGLVYAAAGCVGYFARRALLTWSGAMDAAVHAPDVVACAVVALGIGVYWVARRGRLLPGRLLDLGLAFEVAGALGIVASQFWRPFALLPSAAAFGVVPAECVWIIAFPLIVPNTPRKVLAASLVAASVAPLVLVASSYAGHSSLSEPIRVTAYFLPNYVSAVIAFVVAGIVHRSNIRLKRAQEIGSYELLQRIGAGGMGEVWRARHRLLARPAALKLIRSDVFGASALDREAITRRFEREAQDTATLGSTHTIDVYDFGITEEGDFYYVMELLDGVTLQQFVRRYGPMEPARVVYVVQQVCHSLGEAHSRALVHRDIKPANIFLCRLGPDYDFVKVLDFGLVKHLDARAGPMLTVEGTTAGTPAYIAPEVALGLDIDGRADLYSLACVAYFLLTGQPVFARDTPVATALAHVNEPPLAPSLRSELDIPPALDALILECLAKDPDARPASAQVLARRLAAAVAPDAWTPDAARAWWHLHGLGLEAKPGSTGEEAAANEPAIAAAESNRCWPRLDRTPVRQHRG